MKGLIHRVGGEGGPVVLVVERERAGFQLGVRNLLLPSSALHVFCGGRVVDGDAGGEGVEKKKRWKGEGRERGETRRESLRALRLRVY